MAVDSRGRGKKKSNFVYLGPGTEADEIYQILTQNQNRIINKYPNSKSLFTKDVFKNMMNVLYNNAPG